MKNEEGENQVSFGEERRTSDHSADLDHIGNKSTKIYERNINVKLVDAGGPYVRVHASLLDIEHSFHADMLVHVESGRMEGVNATMAKGPYPTYCPRALENIKKLEGHVIGPGISRRVVELLGRSQGCVHLVEIFQAAIAFTAMILLGRRSGLDEEVSASEEEDRQKWLPVLKNTCQVFRVDAIGDKR